VEKFVINESHACELTCTIEPLRLFVWCRRDLYYFITGARRRSMSRVREGSNRQPVNRAELLWTRPISSLLVSYQWQT